MDESTACPHCGSPLDINAVFCRHCGSSDDDGWSSEAEGLTGDEEFDYEEFIQENFSPRLTNTQTRPIWRLVAVILLALFALGYLWM